MNKRSVTISLFVIVLLLIPACRETSVYGIDDYVVSLGVTYWVGKGIWRVIKKMGSF